ncbi:MULTISPECIES: YlmC/YmxH family sporulation protein [unclassified Psychrobacillus]|uniref:YlmC/YmxH family sporulation protein n=1 Tax=unclassified Psychrobacillus TaxID=2636677 RepID=UPI00146D2CE6|nr:MULTISPECIES: YlmC/YmxH family sporulation protein [unclassified Psychrobacillus]MCM3357026.1 YlmC/YmxH family sporulation protein [Psychrobacillus sp. MER TA 171]NME05249.1 YlmC/YmxH family sporulation protein [Psychrobacillus sp. BL-248-WT-3]
MKFSDAQQKEVIEANSGQLLGFIVDAEIDKETGHIISFIVETNGAYPTFFNKKRETKKISVQNIAVIGKDVIIVAKNRE